MFNNFTVRAVIVMAALIFIVCPSSSAHAAKTVWAQDDSKFSIFGDLRFRYEQDDNSSKENSRDRERIRIRFGTDYIANKIVTAGFRLATGSDSLTSPHQTLDMRSGYDQNGDFGVDRGYIRLAFDGLRISAGKDQFVGYNPVETLMDIDIQPEGLSAVYTTELSGARLRFAAANYIVNESNFGEDDTLSFYQAKVTFGGDLGIILAAGASSFNDGDQDNAEKPSIQGKTHSIGHIAGEFGPEWAPLGLRVGFAYSVSGAADENIGAGVQDADKVGSVVFVRGKVGTVGFRAYLWDAGYAAMPLHGALAQDNFPFSSNFTGYHLQLNYRLFDAISVDLRYYHQETKNKQLTVVSGVNAMSGDTSVNRVQVNFNVSF